jgi:hypothetical protein
MNTEIGSEAASFISGNIFFEFLVQCSSANCLMFTFFLVHRVPSITQNDVNATEAQDFYQFFTPQKYSNTQKANGVILCKHS